MIDYATEIRNIRLDLGLLQRELAELIGVSRSEVSRAERDMYYPKDIYYMVINRDNKDYKKLVKVIGLEPATAIYIAVGENKIRNLKLEYRN